MKLIRAATVVALACMSALGMGCGGDEESGPPKDETAVEAQAILAPIQSGLKSPTGTVSATTISEVLANSKASGAAGTAAGFVPGGFAPPSSPQGGSPTECIKVDGTGGTMDLACLSNGQLTGTLRYQAAIDSGKTFMVFDYENVCVPAENTCIDGKGAESIEGQPPADATLTLAGDFTVTTDGVAVKYDYGYKMTISGQSIKLEYVVFDSKGNSYVLTASISSDSGTITVRGKNGEFTCNYTNGGANGSCTGSGSFEW